MAAEPVLHLPQRLADEMLAHARRDAPKECVGLLFGQEGRVSRCVPLTNVAARPERRYFADPAGLLAALEAADGRGDDLLALYHSHPLGPPTPSEADVEEARHTVPHLIVTPRGGLRAFRLRRDGFEEVQLVIFSEAEVH